MTSPLHRQIERRRYVQECYRRHNSLSATTSMAPHPSLETTRNPLFHPETGALTQRIRSDRMAPSRRLLKARRTLIRCRAESMPLYASLRLHQQTKLHRSIEFLRRRTNKDYTLIPTHSQSYTYRRAIMAPRDVARARKERKVLGRYGPRMKNAQILEAIRQRRKRGTLIGGMKEGGGMWVSPVLIWVSPSHRLGQSVDEADDRMDVGDSDETEMRVGSAMDEAEETDWEKELRGDMSRDEFAVFLESSEGSSGEEDRMDVNAGDETDLQVDSAIDDAEETAWEKELRGNMSREDFAAFLESSDGVM